MRVLRTLTRERKSPTKGGRETTGNREGKIIPLGTRMDVEVISDEEEHTTGSSDSEPKRRAMGNNPFGRASRSPVVDTRSFASMTLEQLQKLVDEKARQEESALRKIAEKARQE